MMWPCTLKVCYSIALGATRGDTRQTLNLHTEGVLFLTFQISDLPIIVFDRLPN